MENWNIGVMDIESLTTINRIAFFNDQMFHDSMTPIFLCPFCSSGEKVPDIGVHRFLKKLLRISVCRHGPAVDIEIDRVVPDGKDAGQFMGDHHDRRPEAFPELEDQVIQEPGTHRVESG